MTNFLGSDFDDTITPDHVSALVISWPTIGARPGADNDVIEGAGGNDTIHGSGGDDEIGGGTGNDALDGGTGNDEIFGGDGNDSFWGSNEGTDDSDTLYGGAGNDLFDGGAGHARVYGGLGRDTLEGGENNDVLYGDDGNDRLNGGFGQDFLVGGTDNDNLKGDFGADTLIGGEGSDTLDGVYRSALGFTAEPDTIYAGNGNDLIVLNYFVFNPGPSGLVADYVDGGDGSDLLDISQSGNVFDCLVDLGNGTLAVEYFGELIANPQNFFGIEDLIAGIGNDTIYGGSAANFIQSGNGNDIIFGGGGGDEILGDFGDDEIHALPGDTAFGGFGFDTLVIEPTAGDVTVNLATSLDFAQFEVLVTGAGHDSLTGAARGVEWFFGGGGNDTIDGGGGSNLVHGLDGNDLLFSTGSGNDSLFGGDGDDRINLDARTFVIGLTIDGGSGSDTVDLIEGTVTVDSAARFVGIETIDVLQTVIEGTATADNLDFGAYAIVASGVAHGVTINGGSGNDSIAGSNQLAANDTLDGGAGHDTLTGNKGNDQVSGGEDNDAVDGAAGKDSLFGDAGDDILSGGKGVDILFGGLGADRFIFLSVKDSAGGNADVIHASGLAMAFEGAGAAVGDLIDLSLVDANSAVDGDQAFGFGGTGSGQLQVIDKGDNTIILGNTDDDAKFEFRLIIDDGGVLASAYTPEDFLL